MNKDKSDFHGSLIIQKVRNMGAYNSSYLFNAKKLNEEPTVRSSRIPSKNKISREQTGNYYYGARYYNPKWSLWLGVDPLAGEFPHQSPYVFTDNNPIMLWDPSGMAAEEANGEGFWNKLGNFLRRDGFKTNRELADDKFEKEYRDAGNEVLQPVDLITIKPKKTQAYGRKIWGSSKEQLLKTPEADIRGESLEMFPMKGAPGKASGSFWQKLGGGFGILRKFTSWGAKKTPPGTPPAVEPMPSASPQTEPSQGNREVIVEDYHFGEKRDSLMNRYYYSKNPDGTGTRYDSVNYNYYKKENYAK